MTGEEIPKISEEILVALDVIEEQNPKHLPWALTMLDSFSIHIWSPMLYTWSTIKSMSRSRALNSSSHWLARKSISRTDTKGLVVSRSSGVNHKPSTCSIVWSESQFTSVSRTGCMQD